MLEGLHRYYKKIWKSSDNLLSWLKRDTYSFKVNRILSGVWMSSLMTADVSQGLLPFSFFNGAVMD